MIYTRTAGRKRAAVQAPMRESQRIERAPRRASVSPNAVKNSRRPKLTTIRAVADELASAAELAFGKSGGRPAALIRGANFRRGEGSIRDVVMPESFDLFR